MSDPAIAILPVVEDLVDRGTVGFRASYVAKRANVSEADARAVLVELVNDGRLEVEYDLICPDERGRTIQTFTAAQQLPVGETWSSDRCDSDEPFVVTGDLILVKFVPTSEFRASIRRQRVGAKKKVSPPDEVASKRTRWRLMRSSASSSTTTTFTHP